MRFATSCSKTLIRSDWRRFWPIGFLYALISFFMLPLPVWVNRELTDGGALWGGRRAAQVVREMSPGFVILAFFFGLILAMAVYSYQMNGKSVGLMHALPVSRDRQVFSHFAAAMSMLTAANCLTFLLTLLMEALTSSVEIRSLLVWLAVTELVDFFFLEGQIGDFDRLLIDINPANLIIIKNLTIKFPGKMIADLADRNQIPGFRLNSQLFLQFTQGRWQIVFSRRNMSG